MTDDDLHYRIAPLSDAVQARLIEAAMDTPQRPAFGQALKQAIERALTDWRYALPVKASAFAGVAAAGFILGFSQPAPVTELTAIALPDMSILEAQL